LVKRKKLFIAFKFEKKLGLKEKNGLPGSLIIAGSRSESGLKGAFIHNSGN
jgi:hypothetical protein